MARRYDDRSDEAKAWRKLYNTARWKALRLDGLRNEPLCRMCKAQGIINGATIRDHIRPHKGDLDLFWDTRNHQSLCKPHHDAAKQRQEASGLQSGCDVTGWPIDQRHSWSLACKNAEK